jgi:hypothetical protein
MAMKGDRAKYFERDCNCEIESKHPFIQKTKTKILKYKKWKVGKLNTFVFLSVLVTLWLFFLPPRLEATKVHKV